MGFYQEGHDAHSAGNESGQFLAADTLHLPGVCCLHCLMCPCIILYRKLLHVASSHSPLLLSPCRSGFPKSFP